MVWTPGIQPAWLALLIVVIVWSAIWKAIALWKSARNRQVAWFVILCIFNTIGLLEIIYLAFFQEDKNEKRETVVVEDKTVKKVVKKK